MSMTHQKIRMGVTGQTTQLLEPVHGITKHLIILLQIVLPDQMTDAVRERSLKKLLL
jgi:hypothetical protein